MLPRLVRALRSGGVSRVTVVTRADLQTEFDGREPLSECRVLHNPNPELGRMSSIQCGLQGLSENEAVLIHPCDIPLLSADAVHALLSAWSQENRRDEFCARLVTPTGKGGHPLVIGAARVPELSALGPNQTLRDLIHAKPELRLDVIRRGAPGPFLDVNTPEQLAFMEDLLG